MRSLPQKRDWKYSAAIAALTLVACVRVASTYRVFSATVDEPQHLSADYGWLAGAYTTDPTHPPLSRIFFDLPLWLEHVPAPQPANDIDRGNQLLYYGDRYEKNLARARSGNLLFLIIGITTVAAWARRLFSPGAGILAAALYSSIPVILGHAGLITTDMAVAATLPLALLMLDRYLEQPSTHRAIALGVAIGAGMLSKMSFLVYFPACVVVIVALRWRPRFRARDVAAIIVTTLLTVWAGYHFQIGRPVDVPKLTPEILAAAHIPKAVYEARIPAPELVAGIALLKLHNAGGHTAFLLGEQSRKGWWYYFPVVLFYKTPIPLLILFAWGAAILLKQRRRQPLEPLLVTLAILAVAMSSSLNIGIRHIMPLYAPLSIVAAIGALAIWHSARGAFGRVALAGLLAWFFAGVAVEHPDYLAWFNEAAQPNPARIAVDSNLDWGQDVLRLARVVRKRHIDHLYIVMNFSTRMGAHGIEAEWLRPNEKVTGWVAAGENWLAFTDEYDWLRAYQPVQKVGKSIRLYYIP